MDKKLQQLIRELLEGPDSRRVSQQSKDGILPAYLLGRYNKASAASELWDTFPEDPQVLGALLRAAFADSEPDVRERCIHIIANSSWQGKEACLIAGTFDEDSNVRRMSLEALAVLGFSTARVAAERLSVDQSPFVAELAEMLTARQQDWPRYRF